MYAPFFGLSREPFSIAPDPRFLFMSDRHREALAHLLYGVGGGGGFVLLTGEIGAGKTTVGRCFLEQLPSHCVVAYIFNPKLSVFELLQTICSEFGMPAPGEGAGLKAHVDALNRFLLEAHAAGRQALLVIDEAQSLSAEVLEQLRLLTNLETAERKLLQIILIGQPELRQMLAQPGLEQLAQRVIARYHLGALSAEETAQYVAHRLSVAGPGTASPFEGAALSALHRLTGGVPRRINLLADRALLGAYAQGRHRVDRRTVAQAAREVFDTGAAASPGRWPRPLLAGTAVAALLAVAGLAGWAWQQGQAGGGAAQAGLAAGAASAAAAGREAPAASAAAGPAALPADEAAASAALAAAGAGSAAAGVAPPAVALADGALSAVAPASAAGDGAASGAAAMPAVAASGARAGTERPAADEPAEVLAMGLVDEGTAWRELALRWNVAIGQGEPCQVVAQARLACFRLPNGGLPALRLLARPAILTLHGSGGARAMALLVALDEQQATLQVGARRWTLSLPALAGIWRGEAATLWRTPPGWREGIDAASDPETRDWVRRQLAAFSRGGGEAAPLRQRVAAFQMLQGLPPDGRVGPMTLMQLNRQADVDEPRLGPVAAR